MESFNVQVEFKNQHYKKERSGYIIYKSAASLIGKADYYHLKSTMKIKDASF